MSRPTLYGFRQLVAFGVTADTLPILLASYFGVHADSANSTPLVLSRLLAFKPPLSIKLDTFGVSADLLMILPARNLWRVGR